MQCSQLYFLASEYPRAMGGLEAYGEGVGYVVMDPCVEIYKRSPA